MRYAVLSVFTMALLAGACDKPPVEWADPVEIQENPSSTRLALDGGQARFIADSNHFASLPAMAGRCETGTVVARGPAGSAAAWWNVRPDSSAVLYYSVSADSGRSWESPRPVDTTDVSSNGCRRPPPSLAMVGDDIYVAYSMVAPEGKGVFFAHTMSGMVHSPVPVIYGDRLVAASIAADDRNVVVAYEEPNGSRKQVDVAISTSQGHLFEAHAPASRSIDNATAPVIALRDSMLAVSWVTEPRSGSPPVRMVRVGKFDDRGSPTAGAQR
jgi:hypothetical protein